eukprot:XP_001705998.1 Hypothetical protein GL50803_96564 [Giardia lamblia ATCC 50803]
MVLLRGQERDALCMAVHGSVHEGRHPMGVDHPDLVATEKNAHYIMVPQMCCVHKRCHSRIVSVTGL